MKRFLLTLTTFTVVIAVSGCTRHPHPVDSDEPNGPNPSPRDFIRFSTSVHDTRLVGSQWQEGDCIGVYMNCGSTQLAENTPYATDGDGHFYAASDPLYYPEDGTPVDFVSYHPYSDAVEDGLYPVDLLDAPVDLLYSNNATGYTDGTPQLQFRHQLSKLVFMVTHADGDSLNDAGVTADGLYTAGSFDLSTGQWNLTGSGGVFDIPLRSQGADGTSAVFETFVLPQQGEYTVTFELSDGRSSELTMAYSEYLPGKRYIYQVNLSNPEAPLVAVGGSAGIDDWEPIVGVDEIDLIIEDDGGDDPTPHEPTYGNPETYFSETFGDPAGEVAVGSYAGWTNALSAVFGDTHGNLTVRTLDTKDLDGHLLFSKNNVSEVTILGLPEGCVDMVLSYDVTSSQDGLPANGLRVHAGATDMTNLVTGNIALAFVYTNVTLDLPDGTTELRFASAGTQAFRLDNIRLTGRRLL